LTDLHEIWYADVFCLPNLGNVSKCKPKVKVNGGGHIVLSYFGHIFATE